MIETQKNLGCANCQRRDFIKKLGLLAGFSMVTPELMANLPGPVPASAIGNKEDAVKVRLIFAITSLQQQEPDWPNIGFDNAPYIQNMTDSLNSKIQDVKFLPTNVTDSFDVKKMLEQDKADGIAGYLVMQMNPWKEIINIIANNSDKPILFSRLTYAGNGGWEIFTSINLKKGRKGFAFVSSNDFNDTVECARAFALLKNGTAEDFARQATETRIKRTPAATKRTPFEGKLPCLSPEATLAALKGKKILCLEATYKIATEVAEKIFGIKVISVKFDELNNLWKEVSEKRAKPKFDDWKKNADKIVKVSDETLMGVARMYYAMKDLLKKYGASSITIDCLGGCYKGKLGAYPCLGFMELQDEGLLGTCEDDLDCNITMMAFNAMTKGRIGYISDPVIDSSNRAIIYAHCVSTRRYLGKNMPNCHYEILTHSEDHEGASVRVIAPAGYPVTTLKFNLERRLLGIHTGVVTGNDYDDRACRTKIVTEVTGDYEELYRHWDQFGWHRVTFYGDFAEDAKKLAKKIGFEVVMES